MPELPEVETIVRDLRKKVLGRTFLDVWTDWKRVVKRPKNFEAFRSGLKKKKILKITRRGKNILFDLSLGKTLLIHQKLTGHLLFGKWVFKNGEWLPLAKGPLSDDPRNRFLHLIFWLDNNQMLALSDLRKFAKAELWDSAEFKKSEGFKKLGIEPLSSSFTLESFSGILKEKKGKIKQILMDQNVIAGIGNIYSDEILWQAKIHPFKNTGEIGAVEIKRIYQAIKEVLSKAIKLGGASTSDFRRISGEKGKFDEVRKAYQREGEKCKRCGTIIKRVKLSGRSAHFCPVCQKL